jgi:hypothetical protein
MTAALCFFALTARVTAHKTVVSPFTYYAHVKPIVDRLCARCHTGAPQPRVLTFDAAAQRPYLFQQSLLTHPPGAEALTVVEFDTLMTWSAGGSPEGARPTGAPLSQLPRRHGAHAGEHGGAMLAMFGDTQHVEAVWEEQRRFRVYVNNAEGQLLAPLALRDWQVRVADPSGQPAIATPSSNGDYFEARIPSTSLPGTFTVSVRRPDRREDAVTITFTSHSIPPPEFTMTPTVIPSSTSLIVAALKDQASVAQRMIAEFQYASLYVPTTRVRDLAVALTPAGAAQSAALQLLIRAAWALHIAGDVGSPQEARQAGERFNAAMNEFATAFVS